jgi:hypothetical protein
MRTPLSVTVALVMGFANGGEFVARSSLALAGTSGMMLTAAMASGSINAERDSICAFFMNVYS